MKYPNEGQYQFMYPDRLATQLRNSHAHSFKLCKRTSEIDFFKTPLVECGQNLNYKKRIR
jgi:hypothetical protein